MRFRCSCLVAGFLYAAQLIHPSVACPQSQKGITRNTEEAFFQDIPSVFGASKFEQKVTEAPSSVTIITHNDIKKYGYRTLADILRSIRGFYVTYDRNYFYSGVRGFGRPGDYNTRILLLIDGHKLNDSIYEQAPIGTELPIDVDLIDRMEIIRGPSSSIYGTNAFFGVINILTRRGRDLKGAEVSAEGARFETYKGRASYGNRYSSGIELLLSGSYYNSEGQDLFFKEFDHPSTNNGVAKDLDWDTYYQFFSRASMRDFTLEGVYSSRDKGIPTAPWGISFNDPSASTTDQRGYLDLKYEHIFSNDFSLTSRIFYDHYGYDGTYPYRRIEPGDMPETYHSKDLGRADWWGGEIQATKKLFENHKLLVGAEFDDNFGQKQQVYEDNPLILDLDSRKSSFNWAAYIEDQYQILNKLILNAGFRYDYYETFGGTLSPRVALIYNPFQKTALKLIYGEAFRAPNAYELYYDDGYSIKAAKELEPEKTRTYEAIWEQYLGDNHRMTTEAYYYNISNLTNLEMDPADQLLVYRNIGRVNAFGFEWELDSKWRSGIESRISYTFQEARDDRDNAILTNSPLHQAKFNLILPVISNKAFLGSELLYMSSRKTLSGRNTDDVLLANLTLYTQNFVRGLEVSASAYNLLNQKYGDPGSDEHVQDIIGQDGINFRIKVTYSF